jgi:hypothetical protein
MESMPQAPSVDPSFELRMRAIGNLIEQKGIKMDQGAMLPPEEVEAEMERLRKEASGS